MKKRIWFYLCIAQSIVILGVVFMMILPSLVGKEVQQLDLVEYLGQFDEGNNYLPEVGYIPDAKTAQVVGSAIIDKMIGSGYTLISTITVKYDNENRLWLIEKGYFPHHGGFVIIKQDSGEIVKALLTK